MRSTRLGIRTAAIALACAAAQALVLVHALVGCLPYKEMVERAAYRAAGLVAAVTGPLIAVAFTFLLFSARRRYLIPVLLVSAALITPLAFAITVHVAVPPSPQFSPLHDFSPTSAWRAFVKAIAQVVLLGTAASFVLGTLVAFWATPAEESAV